MKRYYCNGKKGYCGRGNDDYIDCRNCEFADGTGGEVVDCPDTVIGKSMEKDCRDFKNCKNFIDLPCKICDVVWTCLNGYVSKAKVWGISTENYLYEQQIYLKVRVKDKSNFVFDKTLLFGKTVFLTKEEAEQKLKGGNE